MEENMIKESVSKFFLFCPKTEQVLLFLLTLQSTVSRTIALGCFVPSLITVAYSYK